MPPLTVSQYRGAPVSGLFYQRWRTATKQVGAAKPTCLVQVRKGFFKRDFVTWPGQQFGEHSGGRQGKAWAPKWTPYTNYIQIPGVKEVTIEQSFDNNGVATLTLHMDNINWKAQSGPGGAYHSLLRGFFAPLYGVIPQGLPRSDMVADPNFYMLFPNAQITVWEGYGPDTLLKTFTGLIDDIDPESTPDMLTVTARDFGSVLVDQNVYGWVKDPYVQSPVVFAPRGVAEQRKRVGGGALASSEQSGYPARSVLLSGNRGHWRSKPRTDPNQIDWIQIHVPEGKYSSMYLAPEFAGQEIWLGFFCRTRGSGGARAPSELRLDDSLGITQLGAGSFMDVAGTSNGVPFGWLNLGQGYVPATDGPYNDGPWPFFRHIQALDRMRPISFGFELNVGRDSVLRVGMRSNRRTTIDGRRYYQSGVKQLKANQNVLKKEALRNRWVVVSDVTEIVMCCLRWAGFRDWEVESGGVELKEKYVVDKSKKLIDIINDVKDQLGYSFFIGEPIQSDDLSIGNPIFRQTRVLNPTAQVDEVRDSDLVENVKVKWSNKQERTHIIVRGKLLKKSQGGERAHDGTGDSKDRNYRAAFHYTPPWAFRNAGVIKWLVHYDVKYQTKADCAVACYLIALQIALSIVTAIVAVPGTPHIGLDSLVSITDHATGTYSRMYVSNKRRTYTSGEDTKYTMEMGGSLIDTPDMNTLMGDLLNGLFNNDRNDKTEE